MEGVLDDVENRAVVLDDDLHDVEADEDVGVVEQPQPGEGAAGDELLLGARDRLGGRAVAEAAPGFDLDENQRVAGFVAADEIDFATARRAEIAVENFVTVPP